ncbi:aa3-type cytochrome oxidase subunit II [Nocardioides limicola]|uniref:aa3-type cytochrome oxidase subunit II n=1 Tax=Nocardioides limicola TaxID=2803368 RepID=UPI0027DD8E12|nr:cytochrome c oxidase subunit II [Nocardioides sp. DJM-14]
MLGALLGSAVLVLGACSVDDVVNFGWAMPDPATEQGPHIYELWRWSWWAAMATGAVVWALIFWVIWRYRRRSDEDVPVQTRYNLPLEIFYTIAPIMMVIVFFYWTVTVQNVVLAEVDDPDVTVEVVGQQWSWTFNYMDEDAVDAPVVYAAGTASQIPTLWLPKDETVHFNLHSPDVIHSFWVVGFLMKMDVVPGRVNSFQVTPNVEGTFKGKCAELCGTYHSRMLFDVNVVSRAEYDAYLQSLYDLGNFSDTPLLGGSDARTQAGLNTNGDH